MPTLKEILQEANQWVPQGGWRANQPVVIGRDILAAPNIRARWEQGLIYLNPGRDARMARDADASLHLRLTQSLPQFSTRDRRRAEFVRDCLNDHNWCRDPILVKILLYDDRIEVFTGDPQPVWPSAVTANWPIDWTLYRLNRYIRWDMEPLSAGRYWQIPAKGPCPDGSWPKLYSRFLGCICCTNGMLLFRFERVWSCGTPRLALALRVDGGTETVMIPNLPASALVIHRAASQMTPRDFDFSQWEGSKAKRQTEDLLGAIDLLRVPSQLVLQSQLEEWPLEEQLNAEEIAGAIASAILDKANTEQEPPNQKETHMYETFVEEKGYAPELQRCIEETVDKLQDVETEFNKPGMLLGKIQSGKTRAYVGIIARAFDEGYDVAVVLTKGTIALAEQTVQRLNSEFLAFVEADAVKVYDIMNLPTQLGAYVLDQKLIFVVKKEDDNLRELDKLFFEANPTLAQKKVLLIDDEADYASIGFKRERGEIKFNVLARMISEFREKLEGSCSFLQVTATPYSLYLQPEDIAVQGAVFQPMQPAFTVLLPVHDQFVGGAFFFPGDGGEALRPEIAPLAPFVHIEMPDDEFRVLGKRDQRLLTNILTTPNLAVFRRAIVNFIMGGVIRNTQQEGDRRYKCAMIVHTETAKAKHEWQLELVNALLAGLRRWSQEPEHWEDLAALLRASHQDIAQSVQAGWQEADPPLIAEDQAIELARDTIQRGYVVVKKVNSEAETSTLLDRRGQLRLDDPFNIFVGGQILDRGLTIDNLIGFIYGRNPQRFQQNTVMQHSRMYGARPKADLAVTRFYTSARIYLAMRRMNQFDSALRQAFDQGGHEAGIAFIQKDTKGRIIPCSPNHVLISNTVTLRPGGRLLPIGMQTKAAGHLRPLVRQVDDMLTGAPGYQVDQPFLMDLGLAKEILSRIRESFEYAERHDNNDYAWDVRTDRAILDYVNSLVADGLPEKNRVHVLVRTGRQMSRRLMADGGFSDAPDSEADRPVARQAAQNAPCLMLLKQEGTEEQGWRGAEFWWPVIVLPANMQTAIFSEKPVEAEDDDDAE